VSAGRVAQVDTTVVTAALCVQISLTSINLVQFTECWADQSQQNTIFNY